MNPASESQSLPPHANERLLYLLSCQHDGELTQEEAEEFAKMVETSASLAFQAGISDVHLRFAAIPVVPVGAAFSKSVLGAIGSQSGPTLSRPASPIPEPRQGRIARSVVAVTIAACALVLLMVVRPFSAQRMQLASSGSADSTATQSMAQLDRRADFPADSELEVLKSQKTEGTSSLAAAAERGMGGMGGGAAGGMAGGAAGGFGGGSTDEDDALQPFFESDDWRIVVVKVNSTDRETVMRDIEALVKKQGMDIRPVVDGSDRDARFGVLLTSAGADEKDFVESVLPASDAHSTNWNADSVAQSSRASVIQRLQESMKTPTHSELHFGLVYLTLPKLYESTEESLITMAEPSVGRGTGSTEAAAGSLPTPEAKVAARSFPLPQNSNSPDVADQISPAKPGSLPRKPVLIVFEFSDIRTHGAFDGRI